jgi:DNA repair protein RecO (recombination protein O)
MSRGREYQTTAIIVKKTRLGEADHILTMYTPDEGKIQAVAKGVRRPKSKMAGHLELLTHIQVTLARGRNLDIVTGCQTIDSFLVLKNDLLLTSCGLYVTELANQFTPEHVPDETIFRLLLETLRELCQTVNRELLLRHFEMHLLDESGYRPQLRECVSCHLPLEPVVNSFSASSGGTLCPVCGHRQPFAYGISVNALKVLRFIQDNSSTVVTRLKIDSRLSHELENITRGYLKYLLEKDVKSAAWLDEIREQLRSMAPEESKTGTETGTEAAQ